MLVACSLAGCGGAREFACTLIGCESGLTVLFGDVTHGFPDARAVRVCANTVCTTYPAGPVGERCGPEVLKGTNVCEYVRSGRHERRARRLVSMTLRSGWLEHAKTMRVTLEVLGTGPRPLFSGATLARFVKTAPNGVRCGPVCYDAELIFDPRRKRFVEAARHRRLAQQLKREAYVGRAPDLLGGAKRSP